MEGFRDTVNVCGFQDLGFSGPKFTWCNMCEGNDRVYLRLDRAFANSDWLNAFQNCRAHPIVDSTLDHCILRITDSRAPALSRKCHFHFEALWAKREDCYGIVEAAWNRGNPSNTLGDIAANLHLCASELSTWSKEVFRNIPKRIQEKRKALHTLTELDCDGSHSGAINELRKELNELLDSEETL